MRIALAQINPTVGDIHNNTRKIFSYIKQAIQKKANIIVFPELALTGYPPEDLVNMPEFINQNLAALEKIRESSKGITAIIGFINRDSKSHLYNSAAIIDNRKILGIYNKMHLPNYGVFDEKRYFGVGKSCQVFKLNNTKIGVNICEDIWVEDGPTVKQSKQGKAKIIINISSSPFHAGKHNERVEMLKKRAVDNQVHIVYVNLVGGQDELVFDGRSMIFNPAGEIIAQAKGFQEELLLADLPAKRVAFESAGVPLVEEVYEALKLGLRDYITKNGFKRVIIGLSGGIDSALTALIAADALGGENVLGFYLPSEFSSKLSEQAAIELANNLGVKLMSIPIKDIYYNYLKSLKLSTKEITLTHENLQARIRGTILMAFSNKLNALVLTTGNKSELSTGYATLYGDMAGGFALLKDVPKTLVYELSTHGNDVFYKRIKKDAIPLAIINRPPTAELRPNQKDSDSLPEYHILDPILREYIENNKGLDEIVKELRTPSKIVAKVIKMVDRSEYKRRQSPPGVKITHRAFGRDRRFPITNRFFSLD